MWGRVILMSIVAGIAMFVWGFLYHAVLPFGETGVKELPNEAQTVEILKANLTQPGFYFFPGMGDYKSLSKEEQKTAMKVWEEKYKQGPLGILIYQPAGRAVMSAKQMIIQLKSNIFTALFVAIMMAMGAAGLRSYGRRLLFATLAGLAASAATQVPLWNWYGYPGDYILAAIVGCVITFFVGGLVLAAGIKPKAQAA